MNAAAEIREEYKSAVRMYIKHARGEKTVYRRAEFYEGRMSGLEVALSVLGVTSDEIREMYKLREEDTLDEIAQEAQEDFFSSEDAQRIQQAATDAANQIEREKEEAEEEAGDLIESTIINYWKEQGGIYKQAAEEYENDTDLCKQAKAELAQEEHER
ncbi:MAG: hypothetical protein WA977_08560 [Halobacteriota archaeon]